MLKISSFEVVGIQIISVSTVNLGITDCIKMNFIIGLKLHEWLKNNKNLSLIYPCVSFINSSDKTQLFSQLNMSFCTDTFVTAQR